MSLLQLDDDLISQVSAELAALVASEFIPPRITPHPWDKWTARSGLQKCIRRGLVDQAIACASRLAVLDLPYLWRTLNVIALEDVGAGDPDTITWTRAIMADKAVFSRTPPLYVLYALVARMCRAPKSRAMCEMSVAMEMGDLNLFHAGSNWTVDQIASYAVNGTMQHSFVACCHLSNKLPETVGFNPSVTKQVKLAAIHQMREATALTPQARRAASYIFAKPTDTMSFSAWGVLRETHAAANEPTTVVLDAIPTSATMHGLPTATWDMHTRNGKIAIKAFYTSLAKNYPLVAAINPDKAGRALGAAVFIEEGGLVDRRVASPAFTALKDWQDEVFAMASGCLSPKHALLLREVVRNEIPRLNEKREWVSKVFDR